MCDKQLHCEEKQNRAKIELFEKFIMTQRKIWFEFFYVLWSNLFYKLLHKKNQFQVDSI